MDTGVWQKYLSTRSDRERQLVVHTLELVPQLVPGTERALPYGIPGWRIGKKNLIAVAAHKNHLGIYPFSPAVVRAVAAQFGIASSEGTLRFPYPDPPPEAVIRNIVTLRLQEL